MARSGVYDQGNASTSASTPAAVTYEYRRIPLPRCGKSDGLEVDRQCIADLAVVVTCADGSAPSAPLYRRAVMSDGTASRSWEQVDLGGCVGPDDRVVLSVEEFRRLPLTAAMPGYQPADGQGLVNVDLIVFADPTPQILATTVVGVPVTVRATPVEWRWDFGDGTPPLLTTSGGAPYPDHTITHPFARPGSYAVVLVTTWRGEYQVNGSGAWQPVAGTAQTTSPPFVAEVVEAPSHLVAGSG